MYRVIVADDEPSALGHICRIIELKCPGYQVAATADNGRDALEAVRARRPDVLISDVKMPIMDGIELVSKVKAEFPEILSVIVSGYQDFDYAKGAIQSGVCDYLLKPLKPASLKELLDRLGKKLAALYYDKRNELLRKLCNTFSICDGEEAARYFPAEKYYAALIRRNGLPRRFSRQTGVEIFSMDEEKIMIYGRDEMESMYLCPWDLLFRETFGQLMERVFKRQRDGVSYLTAVVNGEAFSIDALPGVFRQLYRRLDESVVIGRDQFLLRDQPHPAGEVEDFEHIEYLVKFGETEKVTAEAERLFRRWEKEGRTQLYVESQVRFLFHIMRKYHFLRESYENCAFMIDDAFYYAASMEDLKNSILSVVGQGPPAPAAKDDKAQFFDGIVEFLNRHLEDSITLNSICREFGVSQTSLSKMFRSYKGCSFNNYLTQIRIERAKQIMLEDSGIFIKDVAERVGYNDQFYFSRIFRSVVGVCPTEFLTGAAPNGAG